MEHECLLLPVIRHESECSSEPLAGPSSCSQSVTDSSNLDNMFKFDVPTTPEAECRSVADELSIYTRTQGKDFRKLWNMERFSDFAIRRVARKIFATTATSAPSERIFSRSGLLMAPLRSSTGDSTLENLTFLRTNVKFLDDPVLRRFSQDS